MLTIYGMQDSKAISLKIYAIIYHNLSIQKENIRINLSKLLKEAYGGKIYLARAKSQVLMQHK